jgi:methylmalonyl-CoA mutase N-terminal domain/subunit
LLGAILGGLPGAVVASYDEALALPSAEAVRVALRTQQIVAEETGIFDTADPLGGSYYIESLTDKLEEKATEIFDKVQSMGGAVAAIEQGFQQREIAHSAYEKQKQIESGETVLVGVNKYVVNEPVTIEVRKVDPEEERRQVEKVKKLRRERDNEKVKKSLEQLREAANDGVNLVPCLLGVVKTYATLGEVCDTLRGVYGEYKSMGL